MVKSVKSDILFERNLAPCPGCGQSDRLKIGRRVITFWDQNEKDQVICDRCGWRGPEANSAADARGLWNLRRDQRSWVRMAIDALIQVQSEKYGWSAKIHPEDREKWEKYERSIQLLEMLNPNTRERELE